MTEAEWNCATDSDKMLAALREVGGERKLRLYAVACCRRVWHLLPGEGSRRAVLVAECDADGGADPEDLRLALTSAENLAEVLTVTSRTAAQEAGASAACAALNAALVLNGAFTAERAAEYAAANACSAVFHAATATHSPSAARARDAEPPPSAGCSAASSGRCRFGTSSSTPACAPGTRAASRSWPAPPTRTAPSPPAP